jgi:hypothetical protein
MIRLKKQNRFVTNEPIEKSQVSKKELITIRSLVTNEFKNYRKLKINETKNHWF